MLESVSDDWGFKFTATASYDHPLSGIQCLLENAVVEHAYRSILVEERFCFVHSVNAELHRQILHDLDFIADLASNPAHLVLLKNVFLQNSNTSLFSQIFKWVAYFSLQSADAAAVTAACQRYHCFFSMARELIDFSHQPCATARALQSTAFEHKVCIDSISDRDFPFELSEIDLSCECVAGVKVSSSTSSASSARQLLTSHSRGWTSSGRIGSLCWKYF
jgi:hypothetical protein